MKLSEQIELKEFRDIQVWCEAIGRYRALGFRSDSKLARRSEECKAIIKYEIGEELDALLKKQGELVEKYISLVKSKRKKKNQEDEGLTEIEVETADKALLEDPETDNISKQIDELWSRKVDNHLKVIKISAPDNCIEKFDGNILVINAYGAEYRTEAYSALMEMIKKGYAIED